MPDQHRGIRAIDELHTWQLRRLPIITMMGAGVTLKQVRVWQARIASDDAERAAHESTRTGTEDVASTRSQHIDSIRTQGVADSAVHPGWVVGMLSAGWALIDHRLEA